MSNAFNYNKVLVLGATSGIGRALAEQILLNSKAKVVVTGRRKDRLAEFVDAHGKDGRVSSASVDVTDLKALPAVLEGILNEHPDIDMVVHNSGISRRLDFTNPSSIDVDEVATELTTNYTSIIHVLKAVLPHLLAKGEGQSGEGQKNAAFAAVTSQLGMFPYVTVANYSATKAASHALMISLRAQLRHSNVKVIEIPPTAVTTELLTPGKPSEKQWGMPLDDYITGVWKGLAAGEELICVGTFPELQELEEIRNKVVKTMNQL